jgi:hypothetical protein
MPDGSVMLTTSAERVAGILRRHDQAVSERSNWESLWQEIAERVLPRSAFFTTKNLTEGEKRTQKLFDSTAPLALTRFAAAMESMLTPRTQRWHKLTTRNKALMKSLPVKRYLEDVTDILFAARYSSSANYASQAYENYMSLGAFGTGGVFVDEIMGISLRYRALHLSELYIFENAAGVIDTVHRPFTLTARQVMQRAQSEGWSNIPEAIVNAAKDAPDRKFDFLHVVQPNAEIESGKRDYRGMKYASCYIAIDGRCEVSRGGYRTFPYAVSRYVTGPREVYGRSPAMDALPSILTLNEQKKTVLRAGQKVVDPPLLLQDDGALAAFDLRSGAMNYGTINSRGEALVQAFETKGKVEIGLELMQEERKLINDHFLVTLFQILVDAPQMTATEAMLRAQEKGALLAPTMGRQQSEMLGPQIEREIDILAHAGQFPPMPDELLAAGGEIEIEYDSPLTRAQKSDQAIGILNTFQAVAPFAEARPEVLDKFDFDKAVDVIADVNGCPASVLVDDDTLKKIRAMKAQQQQQQQILEAAPVAASAAKDLASAQSLAGSAPPFPPPAQ